MSNAKLVATFTNVTAQTDSADFAFGKSSGETHQARFYVDVTSITGTAPVVNVDVYARVGGAAYLLDNIAGSVSAVGTQSISVDMVPPGTLFIRVAIQSGTLTDFDATVRAERI